MEYKFQAVEDNGGGLHLAIFDDANDCVFFHSGYECEIGHISEDIQALKDGSDPLMDWEGNEEDPQGSYDGLTSHEYGWQIVADDEGLYPDKMGRAAMEEFGVEKA